MGNMDHVQDTSDARPDEEAFLQAFLANQRALYAHILVLLSNASDADDVFQETSIILWRKRREFKESLSFRAWACGIAFNAARNLRAKKARERMRVTFDDGLLEQIAGEALAIGHELDARRAALERCLEKISTRDRQLLEYRYAEGATIKSVAERVGRPIEGLYKAMRRIHDQLFDCVGRILGPEEEQA